MYMLAFVALVAGKLAIVGNGGFYATQDGCEQMKEVVEWSDNYVTVLSDYPDMKMECLLVEEDNGTSA